MNYDPGKIERIKELYPPGTQIELISMNDPFAPVPPGTKGVVKNVDDMGTLHMKWENGRTLGVVPGEDFFGVISRPEPAPELDTAPADSQEPDSLEDEAQQCEQSL